MIELNKEAEKYASDFIEDKHLIELQIAAFLQGANSNYVKQQIIQAKIDVLNKIKIEYSPNISIDYACSQEITILKEELKQLEQ